MSTDLLNDPPTPPPTPAAGDPPPPAGDPPAPAAGEKTWLDGLPDDLKASPQLAKFKESGIEGVARSYVNIERMLGNEKVPIPKDPNDQEGWDRYYAAGGRPEDPSKYEFKRPEKLPEGTVYDEGQETWWKQSAHEAGLSQRQAERIYEKYRDRFFSQIELSDKSAGAEVEKARLELQRDWGGEYEARRSLAKAAFAEMPQDVQQMAVRSGLARMPSFVKYLHDTKAKTTGELEPKQGERFTSSTPDQIKAQIAEHRAKHSAALMDTAHPEHDLRATELQALYGKLFPDAA